MKRFIILFICILFASYAITGEPYSGKPDFAAQETIYVSVGDCLNIKHEFWLSSDNTLLVEKIEGDPDKTLRLRLCDRSHQYRYDFYLTKLFIDEYLFVVEKKCGLFDGTYRISRWGFSGILLKLDSKGLPSNFRPLPSEYSEYEPYSSPAK